MLFDLGCCMLIVGTFIPVLKELLGNRLEFRGLGFRDIRVEKKNRLSFGFEVPAIPIFGTLKCLKP